MKSIVLAYLEGSYYISCVSLRISLVASQFNLRMCNNKGISRNIFLKRRKYSYFRSVYHIIVNGSFPSKTTVSCHMKITVTRTSVTTGMI